MKVLTHELTQQHLNWVIAQLEKFHTVRVSDINGGIMVWRNAHSDPYMNYSPCALLSQEGLAIIEREGIAVGPTGVAPHADSDAVSFDGWCAATMRMVLAGFPPIIGPSFIVAGLRARVFEALGPQVTVPDELGPVIPDFGSFSPSGHAS
jgi:hypothetical protein